MPGNDPVVHQSDVEQLQRRSRRIGQKAIGQACLKSPGGMIVRKDNRRGVAQQCPAGDFPGVDRGLIDRAAKHLFCGNELEAGIEKQHREALRAAIANPKLEELLHFLGVVEQIRLAQLFAERAPNQFSGGAQARMPLEELAQRSGLLQRDTGTTQVSTGSAWAAAVRRRACRLRHETTGDQFKVAQFKVARFGRHGLAQRESCVRKVGGGCCAVALAPGGLGAKRMSLGAYAVSRVLHGPKLQVGLGRAIAKRRTMGLATAWDARRSASLHGVRDITSWRFSVQPVVEQASFLTLHYRISLSEERKPVIDTFGERPATLQLGLGQLAAPLESRLIGLSEGDRRVFELPAGEAFGPRNPALLQRIARELFDRHLGPEASFLPGDWIDFPRPDGGRYAGVLKEMHADHVLVDFNHPLAGKAIDFEVEVLSVL